MKQLQVYLIAILLINIKNYFNAAY